MRVIIGDGGSNLSEDIDWYIFLPQNAIISGDSILNFGSGDYTTQNSTNDIIQNQNQNQEESQGFFQNLYNNLFSGDTSGEINRAINKIKTDFNFSGDEQLEKQILQIASQNNGDFRIAWESYKPKLTINNVNQAEKPLIPSGEINFSQIERENPEFQTTMNWARIFINISLVTLILREYYKLLMDAIGGSVLIADSDKDSNRIIDKGDN